MNKSVIAIFAAFAAGAAVSYFMTRKLLEEQYAQIAQEEIDSVKEIFGRTPVSDDMYDKKAEKSGNVMTDEEYADRQESRINPNASMTRSSLSLGTVKSEQAKQNYHLIGAQTNGDKVEPVYSEDGDDEEDEEDEDYPKSEVYDGQERDLTHIDRTQPYVISGEEYTDEFEHHDKISLYYYVLDDTLANEREEIMDDIDGTVGWEVFKVLEMQNCAWVRNEPLGIDYEICAVRNSYTQAVHGIRQDENLSPRERYLRQQKRREKDEDDE